MKTASIHSLLLTDTFLPHIGGRENYYHHLFSRFGGNSAIILTPDKVGDYEAFDRTYPLPIVRINRISQVWWRWGIRGRIQWLRQLDRICRDRQIAVLHCGLVLPDGLTGWLVRKTLGQPYIIYTHGKEILENQNHPEKSQLMQIALSEASRVACNSRYTGKLLEAVGVPPEKIVPILPGIEPQQWLSAPDPQRVEELRQKYGLADRPVVLSVGRLIERKGCDRVLEAFPKILSHFPDAVYLIVGEGPMRSQLEQLRDRLGLQQSVIFAGEVSDADLRVYYTLATLFAMVSRQPPGSHEVEGFGIVYLEANACGLPVVAGDSGGVSDAVVHGKTGFLVDPFNPDAIADAIIPLLADPQLAQQMGKTGKERAIQEFSWDTRSQALQQLTAEVAQQTQARSRTRAAIHTLPLMLQRQIFR